ncbi:MAG: hypothetical protein E7218_01185 [Anaerofustis stercorihominis]|nr:hypothetical protein [Anaerofustis stercorihominis]
MKKAKKITFVLILVAVAVCVVGTTLAWLQDSEGPVVNTFTPSNVKIDLDETQTEREFKMVPGWTIAKEPYVTVEAGSEDCFVFIEVIKSDNLDEYIDYAIVADDPDTEAFEGWRALEGNEGVYYRTVKDIASNQEFGILAGGSNEDMEGFAPFTWTADQVLVKPTVTEKMMEDLATEGNPTLSFKAYAVQLWKNNTEEFKPEEAWAIAKPVVTP